MARTLITFIGTGSLVDRNKDVHEREYRSATYRIGGKDYTSSFVADALYEHYNIDHLYIIGTVKSMWEEIYTIFCKKLNYKLDNDYTLELAIKASESNWKSDLDSLDLDQFKKTFQGKITPVVIPYGLNKSEQVQIFNELVKILKQVDTNGQLYLDITHSFRSLPLIAQSAIQYVQEVLDFDFRAKVTYGMLDITRELDYAPLVDVSIVSEFAEWTKAAHSFKDYGKGYLLVEMLEDENPGLAKKIKEFSDVVGINYISDAKNQLNQLENIYKNDEVKNDIAKLVIPDVIKKFVDKLKPVKNNNGVFQYYLSLWHGDHKNFALAYIVFVESILTFACEQSGKKWNNKEHREFIKGKIVKKNLHNLKSIYCPANESRKTIAHALEVKGSSGIEKAITNLKKYQEAFENILRENNLV